MYIISLSYKHAMKAYFYKPKETAYLKRIECFVFWQNVLKNKAIKCKIHLAF